MGLPPVKSPERCGHVRHQRYRGVGLPAAHALIGREKEGIVQQRGSSHRCAELILPENRTRQRGIVEEVARVGGFVPEIVEDAAVKLPAAGLGNHIDYRPAGFREFGRCHRRLDAELLYAFERRIDGHGEYQAVGICAAVQQVGIRGGARAIYRQDWIAPVRGCPGSRFEHRW